MPGRSLNWVVAGGHALVAIHHIRLNVSDLARSEQFYSPVLTWLGFEVLKPHGEGPVKRLRFSKEGLILLISQAAVPETASTAKSRPASPVVRRLEQGGGG